MSRIIFWPYNLGSQGCKELAHLLGALRVRSNGNYRPRATDVLINWGNGAGARVNWNIHQVGQLLNLPQAVSTASDKLSCLTTLREAGILVPLFGNNRDEMAHLLAEGRVRRVYCRTLTRASEGRGIVVATSTDGLVDAPLYTAGIDGYRDEYRVHVFHGEVIDVVQKRKMSSEKLEEEGLIYDPHVRNHDKGWVFSREGIDVPESVRQAAIAATVAVGLDFGAVDIIVRRNALSQAFVLEINTAPGLEGTTLTRYAEAIRRLI
jgi:hypothetical protein